MQTKELELEQDIKTIVEELNLNYTVEELKQIFKCSYAKNIWHYTVRNYELPKSFIKKHCEKIKWIYISQYQRLSEDFIREFQDKVDWESISEYQKLTEDFIREFQKKVNWYYISMYQKLSEDFIREFQNEVNWYNISIYQKLSEDFIREFKDKVNWDYVSKYQKLSTKIIKELNITIDEDNWLYKSTNYKKNKVIDSGLYECYDDYFFAYKGIRRDNYSCFNFQYKYEVGGIYQCHADHTINSNSFGLSAWTLENAKNYCDEKIIKVKIHYKDVARLLNFGKIRCTKLEVIEEL